MNRDQLKTLLVRDKEYLRQLYESRDLINTKRILQNASDVKLNTLIRYIHFVSNGEIHIKKADFENLGKKHMAFIRKRFESKKHVQQILQQSRKFKLQLLTKLTPVFCDILTPLFRE